jgi:ring-1,2-phenylacetyl-CoA epoxidase subunit PaaC
MSDRITGIAPAERDVLLALADDEHLMGQRHTEWIGVAPFIEEDLAFASIGQDELGHATMLYELLEGDDADRLALLRDPGEYRSCWLAEAACTDWADALVRHWLYDEAELLRWQALADSSLQALRDIASRALAEETYHRRHAAALLDALRSEHDAQGRLVEAAAWLVPLGLALFDPPPGQDDADPAVVGRPLPSMAQEWTSRVAARFSVGPIGGGAEAQEHRTVRSAGFAEVYARMREVLMLDPTAQW